MKKVSLEDMMLCDPISKRGREALERIVEIYPEFHLTIGDFYDPENGIYVEPFFMQKDVASDESGITNEEMYLEGIPDSIFSSDGASIARCREKKEAYENLFFSKSGNQLMFIRAASGTGKSAYLNYLKWKRRQRIGVVVEGDPDANHGILNDAYELSFDLERSPNRITRKNYQFPSKRFFHKKTADHQIPAPWCFFIMLLEATCRLMCNILEDADENRLASIRNNIQKLYGDAWSDGIRQLFAFHKSYCKTTEEKLGQAETILKSLLEICLDDLDDLYENSVTEAIVTILECLTRLISSLSDLNTPKQVLVSFDGIEHYINLNNRIFDGDIEVIVAALERFTTYEDIHYKKYDLKFSEFYRFILAIRDTTNSMFKMDLQTAFNLGDRSIVVTNWYRTEQVYTRKIDYFSSIIGNTEATKLFKLLINDSGNTKGYNTVMAVSDMYNHNKRRTTCILSRVSNRFDYLSSSTASNGNYMNYSRFANLFKENKNTQITFLCRQSILRLIYNEISATGYFDRILSSNDSVSNNNKSFTRRILTWLANTYATNGNEQISLQELLNGALGCPFMRNQEFEEPTLMQLAQTLIALEEYRFELGGDGFSSKSNNNLANRWCQLITISMHEEKNSHTILDAEVLKKLLLNITQGINDQNTTCKIGLTDAGNYFIRRFSSFEFISCLCNPNGKPLLLMVDPEEVKSTIQHVYDYSKKLIDSTISFEYSFFNGNFRAVYELNYHLKHKDVPIPFAIRITDQHKDYLNKYLDYIKDKAAHEETGFAKKQLSDIQQHIIEYMNKYTTIYNQLVNSEYHIDSTVIRNYAQPLHISS